MPARVPQAKRALIERKQRARALATLKEVRALQSRGLRGEAFRSAKKLSREEAVGKLISARVQAKIPGRPFVSEEESKHGEVMKKVKKTFLPTRKDARRLAMERAFERMKVTSSAQKCSLIKSFFGSGSVEGRLGMVVLKPSLYGSSRAVSKFLAQTGLRAVFSKTMALNKKEFLAMYPQTFDYAARVPNYGVFAAGMTSGPIKVIVFEFPKVAGHTVADSLGAPTYGHGKSNGVADALKVFLRNSFGKEGFARKGLVKDISQLKQVGRDFDALGYVEARLPKDEHALTAISDFHVPVGSEIPRDAAALLSLADLERIRRVVRP